MSIVKPLRLGVVSRAQQEPPKVYFFVGAFGYFDLLDPSDFDLETRMWQMTAAALGGAPLDLGMPKPRGEVAVIGDAAAPGGRPVNRMAVEISLGPVRKDLIVFGDRHWELTDDRPVFTAALPFERVPLVWEKAFGGRGFAGNPVGVGHGARAALAQGRPARLPNVEDASDLILDVDQVPRPAGLAPLDIMAPARQRYAGTYDDAWTKRHHPGHAVDFDWAFYNCTASDQWAPGFFTGDEPIRIAGMHSDHPVIRSRLPGMRVRAFLNLQRDGARTLTEIAMRCETVMLFPGQLKGVVIYRGGCETVDIDGKDVVDTMLAYERLEDPPRSAEHYAQVFRERSDPETAALSFFNEAPLRPDIPEYERAEREAERVSLASEREANWDRRAEAMIARAYRAAGALPPPPGSIPKPSPPVPLPVITPGDIERMDVDMVKVSDALHKLRAYGDEQIGMARQRAAALLTEVADLVDGPGGSLLDAGRAGRIRAAAASLPRPSDGIAPILPAGTPTLDSLRRELSRSSALEEAGDPFADVVAALRETAAAAGPLGDDEKAVLRARAEGRPEGRMTASLLDQVGNVDLTAGGVAAPPSAGLPAAAPGADPPGIDAFLEELGLDGPSGAADAMRAFDEAVGELGPAAALTRPLMAAAPPGATVTDPAEALDQVHARLADAAPGLEAAFATGRRMSPEPLAPVEALGDEAAHYLGRRVRECLTGGGDIAGRDWAGARLGGVDFSGRNLRGSMFERADLTNADFRGAVLEDAVFTGATLTGADFSGCSMRGANLSNAEAAGVRFVRSDLRDARLIATKLADADLSQSTFESTIAMNADLTRADLSGARFTKVVFMATALEDATLDGGELHGCVFLQVAMSRMSALATVFARCTLVDCDARGGDFTGADFSDSGSIGGAVYDGSVMRDLVAPRSGWHGASMVGVDLHAACLDGSDLGEADLSGARLTRASLRRAVLIETVMSEADLGAATLVEAQLRRADLRGASLRHANLYSANLDESALGYCDLTGVDATGTCLARDTDVAG